MANHSTRKTQARKAGVSTRSASAKPPRNFSEHVKEYARERPEVIALWCFGLGFIFGWKLKP